MHSTHCEQVYCPNVVETTMKRRVEWIDNGRMIAALLVLCLHVPLVFHAAGGGVVSRIVQMWMFRGEVPFFLFFAGYFLARNVTWHKALKRACLLFIPFFLWNALYYFFHAIPAGHGGQFFTDLLSILGIGNVFTPDLHLFGSPAMLPKVGPSWFLRDIIVLTLLTPLFARFKVFFGIVLILVMATLPGYHAHTQMCDAMLSPGTCFFYILGVCASGRAVQDAELILNRRFTPVLVAAVLCGIALGVAAYLKILTPLSFTLPGGLLGILLISHAGLLIERHCPKLSGMLSSCAPACFLIYMLHLPMMQIAIGFIPAWYSEGWLAWLTPFILSAVVILGWLGMRKWTPWLLPVLAHDKWRR